MKREKQFGKTMNEKYKNKYRIQSTRLQNWDYGWNGAYFVTICTKNRIHYFGEIIRKGAKSCASLSEIGQVAQKYWHEIPQHFPFVKLGAFVVMPNHIHGIIIIDKTDDDNGNVDVDGGNDTTVGNNATVETPNLGVSTETETNTETNTGNINTKMGGKNPKWKSGSLGSIINQYKRICTINARKTNPDFAWQPRYYDHIIRNNKSFYNISEYIINNPLNWKSDKFYKIKDDDNENIVSEPNVEYITKNYNNYF